ncbi:TPA: DNA replication protein DnaC, partial [Escherichia coli]
MKNITSGGVLARVSRFVPQDAIPPYRTVAEWREWQLAEGRKRSEEVNRLN